MARLETRGASSCQHALFMFRWLDRPPEDFVPDSSVDPGRTALPSTDADHRLRWDLSELHAALNDERRDRGLTWAELAGELGCTPARLTNLKAAKLADLALVMTITQWLGRPATEFIHPAAW